MRLAIVGSRAYRNRNRIARLITKYVDHYGAGNVIILSGGCPKGADALAKDIALRRGLLYEEYPPAHAHHNEYCALPASEYGKAYNVRHYFDRNELIAERCDHLVAFVVKDVACRGSMHTFSKAIKLKKTCFLFEDDPLEQRKEGQA